MKKRRNNTGRATRSRRLATGSALAVGVAVLTAGGIFWGSQNVSQAQPSASEQSVVRVAPGSRYSYQIGRPGPGEMAPPIRLEATTGGTFDLASLRGKTVLLYFQEGVMCQPCWDQLKDIEANIQRFRDLGIDEVVSITVDPIDVLKQKAAIEQLSTPVLSDPNLAVSRSYDTNSYGMMGPNYNGHSFIVLNPEGRILWRADYGGKPTYTMYVPVGQLLDDMRQGLQKAEAQDG